MQIQGPVVQRCNYAAATSMPSIAIYAIHRAAGKVDSNLAQSNVEGDGNEFPGHLRDWRPQRDSNSRSRLRRARRRLQVRPTLSGWSLLAEWGRFRFWCCKSVANAPPRNLANRVFLAERSL